MNNLYDCKEDLEILSESITIIDKFILENKLFFFERIESEAVRFHINKLSRYLKDARGNVRKVLDELTKYLIQVELEAKRVEHIKSLYKLKYSGELYERTNAKEMFRSSEPIALKQKAKLHFRNDYELMDAVFNEYKKREDEVVTTLETPVHEKPTPVAKVRDTQIQKTTISVRKAYERFIKQELSLDLFLDSLENLDRKKFLSLYIRIIINYSKDLIVDKRSSVRARGYILPLVKRRGV